MSGGSHNYLWNRTRLYGELGDASSYECMEQALRDDGHTAAAERVHELVTLLQAAYVIAVELESVFEAQEYKDSCDLGLADVTAAVSDWSRSKDPR